MTRNKLIYHLKTLLVLSIVLAMQVGCETGPVLIETPIGPDASDLLELFEIIGVDYNRVWEFSDPGRIRVSVDGWRQSGVVESISIDVPVGTEIIIPVLQGWRLQFGDSEETVEDRHFGWGWVAIRVTEIQLPDLDRTPASQTASIQLSAALHDATPPDPWSGQTKYGLIFLRRAERPVVPAPEEELDHYKIVGYNKAFPRSGTLADRRRSYREESTLRIPASAEIVVPSQEGWILGFGRHEGPLGPAVHAPNIPDDHHFGVGKVTAQAQDLAPSGVPGWLNAMVVSSHLLRDRMPGDPWFGASNLGFISFSREPRLGKASTESLEIIGIARRRTIFPRLPGHLDASNFHQETVEVTVPAETVEIIPVIRYWELGYGERYTESQIGTGYTFWRRADHHYGVGQVSVVVMNIDRSTPGPFATANIMVTLGLRDRDARDPWFGGIGFYLIYLGRHEN